MSETVSGEVGKITTGEEAGQEYECRFALKDVKGLFFVWDKKIEGLDLLEPGVELAITHDGSKYKKVEKIEGPRKEEAPVTDKGPEKQESKVEKTMKKVEAEDSEAWRIARSCATERVFGNGVRPSDIGDDDLIEMFETADKIATFIATGQKPSKKKE